RPTAARRGSRARRPRSSIPGRSQRVYATVVLVFVNLTGCKAPSERVLRPSVAAGPRAIDTDADPDQQRPQRDREKHAGKHHRPTSAHHGPPSNHRARSHLVTLLVLRTRSSVATTIA